jgi:hypothetical protein
VLQLQNPVGTIQERTIIDGQQRLTTLQLLLDALHPELLAVGAEQPAMRIETLVMNRARSGVTAAVVRDRGVVCAGQGDCVEMRLPRS